MTYKPEYIRMEGTINRLEQMDCNIDGIPELIDHKNKNGIRFPILTNRYYASLIDPDEKNDPIMSIVIPTKDELDVYQDENGCYDTSGEADNFKAPGLQHKYGPTALALISNVCAGLCRECFRKRLFMEGKSNPDETTFPNAEAIAYLKEHKEINTILLSGGDSLMLTNDSIKELLGFLLNPELGHIKTVRFGSKVHAFYPQRIDEGLCRILADFRKRSGKQVHVCTHFEHPKEITDESIRSIRMMRNQGIELYNQTVLLGGINDDPLILNSLFSRLAQHGVRPYYLFQCRPVIGSLGMQVPLKRGIMIINRLNQLSTGLHKPRYSMSTPLGKVEIIGTNPDNGHEIILKMHSSKCAEDTGRLIFYDVDENNPYWFEINTADADIEGEKVAAESAD